MRLLRFALCLLVAFAPAATWSASTPSLKTMTIATREAPPFVIRDPDGDWHGLAIDLWERIAKDEGLDYRFVGTDLKDMVDGVGDGRFDASVGALTVTPDREEKIDFTHPYYVTGFGIAVPRAPSTWFSLLTGLFSWGFLQAILALGGLLFVVGLFFWLAERRSNEEQFGGKAVHGLGSGLWFAAVTMTTVGYGDKAPRTPAGRVLALIWMFTAIIVISTFTGTIASSLTTSRLTSAIEGPADLGKVAVGSVGASASDRWLREEGIDFQSFATVEDGLAALAGGRIGAFVYDKPILQYRIRNGHADKLRLLPGTFGRQDYALALPQGSPLREQIDIALLREIKSADWARNLKATLGED